MSKIHYDIKRLEVFHNRMVEIKQTGKVKHAHCGICSNTGIETEYLHELLQEWPLYSGCRHYPVPASTKRSTSSDVYCRIQTGKKGGMWDKTTKYGRRRWELLDFLIEKFGAELNERRAKTNP
jgi:hypothetical protein